MANQGYAAANIVDFVRGFGQRKKDAQVEGAMKNYLTNPQQAIAEVNAIDANRGIALRDKNVQDQMAADEAASSHQTRYLSAVKNMGAMLQTARDRGADLGQAFDQLSPVMTNGLGIKPEELPAWRERVIANPGLLDDIVNEADNKLRVLTPGAALAKGTKIVANNPAMMKSVVLRDAAGNSHAAVFDPESGTYSSGAPGFAPSPTAPGAPAGGGQLTVDAVRPHLLQQESGGNYSAVNKETGALGAYQVMPDTGKALAARVGVVWRPDLMTSDTPEARKYQDAIGGAAIQEAIANSGGDPAQMAAYYHGGSDRAKWGPRTQKYASEVAARLSGGGGAAGGGFGLETSAVKPTKPDYRLATAEEKAAAGLDPEVPYQISGAGKFEKIGERPMGAQSRNLGKAQPGQIVNYFKTIKNLKSEVTRLLASPDLDSAVGPVQGRVAGFVSKKAAQFQNDMESLGSRLVVQTLRQLKALSATGASGFGNFSNKEGDRLAEQEGSMKLTGDEAVVRRTLQNVQAWADDQLAAMPDIDAIPAPAIQYLRKNPATRAQFDQHFGPGMSALFLGGK
jgi:hypothetical protein